KTPPERGFPRLSHCLEGIEDRPQMRPPSAQVQPLPLAANRPTSTTVRVPVNNLNENNVRAAASHAERLAQFVADDLARAGARDFRHHMHRVRHLVSREL